MKKLLVLGSVLALAACGMDTAKHDADFAGCERVDTTKTHLVYKCPSNMDRFAEIKKQTPTALFFEGGSLVWDDVNADKENTYVEVVFGKYGNIDECVEKFHYRTMVKPMNKDNAEEMYAVVSCKTVAEKTEEPAKDAVAK
ncbi:MAG: hypothetical protein ACLRFF_02045 [Alphaproteobacteria bacterium]